jgi:hypothetical protein
MSPLQGFRMVGGTIRRLRCATPPVIHNAAASAAILLSQNNLLKIPLKYYLFFKLQVFNF